MKGASLPGSIPFELDEGFAVGDRVEVEVDPGKFKKGKVTRVGRLRTRGRSRQEGVWVEMGGKTEHFTIGVVRKLKEEIFVTGDGRPSGASEKVVRKGRVVQKRKIRTGFKMQGGQPVKMSSGEQRDKQRAAVKGARTRKGHSQSIAQKRQRSLNKRKSMGI